MNSNQKSRARKNWRKELSQDGTAATNDLLEKMSTLAKDKREKGDWINPSNLTRYGRAMCRTYPKNIKDGRDLIKVREEYVDKLEHENSKLRQENSKLRQENNQKDEYIKELEAKLQS